MLNDYNLSGKVELQLSNQIMIRPRDQFEFRFNSPFPNYDSFVYLSFYTIQEHTLQFKILDLDNNTFIFNHKFTTDFLAKLHFRRKQNLLLVIRNPSKRRSVRTSVDFHCVSCEDDSISKTALKGNLWHLSLYSLASFIKSLF